MKLLSEAIPSVIWIKKETVLLAAKLEFPWGQNNVRLCLLEAGSGLHLARPEAMFSTLQCQLSIPT
jgi:hypothetical protein